ncbi:berberine bridge enzyme-like D-2 [Mercurialis annua]|uniref:berberine bridge enzyme-like D-2 n=1 Tax=Mercurialis annua TaxID=3986 RepID=UPI00215F06E3|nr:berberine bridge enzyme-like D-2 [Mercurialis annua]
MTNFLARITSSLFNLILSFFLPLSLSVLDHRFNSCLTQNQITNFTIFKENDSAYYYTLLDYSIQNLRFSEPKIPKPLAIILPKTVDELVKIVACCREAVLEIRVRCGGHSYEGTSSVAGDGAKFVIIDMMNMNNISVDLESETAVVEGGATLGETYSAIAEASSVHGFSAGSCPTVGVGGHIGGGGFGLLSRKYGVAADNVVDALLVDANGRLLDRKGMGEEVFWAIRGGGGGGWGIVYAWKIKLSKVPHTVTCFIVSRTGTKDYIAKLVHKWQSVAPKLDEEFYISCFVGAGLPETKTLGISATFKGFYLGSRTEAMSILNKNFPELRVHEQDYKEMSWIDSILFFAGLKQGATVSDLKNRYLHGKNYFKAKSDYIRTEISFSGIKLALDILEKEPKGYVILDPYGGKMDNISSEAIAFPHRKGNIFAIQYLVEWKEKDNIKSNEYLNWIREFYNAMTPFVSWGPRAAYINYMDFDIGVNEMIKEKNILSQDHAVEIARVWGEKYFLGNFDRLVRAKTIIDPDNVFRNQQSIPPLGSKAEI